MFRGLAFSLQRRATPSNTDRRHDLAIEFFWMPGGPFALRCLMALSVKDLPYHSRQLDVSKQENRSPEFLAISPSGTLPVLKDDATVVRESQAIMFYLDRAYRSVPLYGKTPVEAGRTMQEICEQQSYAEPVLHPLIGALIFNRQTTTGEIIQASTRFEGLLGEMNRRLAATGWLAGDSLSAADLNLYPLVRDVIEAHSTEKAAGFGLRPPSLGPFPHVVAWMRRLEPFTSAEK
jgi:glutathione S-transferase